jgi:hypothetical protein
MMFPVHLRLCKRTTPLLSRERREVDVGDVIETLRAFPEDDTAAGDR